MAIGLCSIYNSGEFPRLQLIDGDGIIIWRSRTITIQNIWQSIVNIFDLLWWTFMTIIFMVAKLLERC
jgi:hypothetical protein